MGSWLRKMPLGVVKAGIEEFKRLNCIDQQSEMVHTRVFSKIRQLRNCPNRSEELRSCLNFVQEYRRNIVTRSIDVVDLQKERSSTRSQI